MSSPRPLETGWLADTPVDDNVVRQFVCNQGELNAVIARASGGRVERSHSVLLADAGGSVPYYNQAVLSRPLGGENDPVLGEIDAFYRQAGDRPVTLLSMWPTPDLTPRGWMLVGHPAFVVRGPFPFSHEPAKGVEVREVRSAEDLAVTERIAIEGYPMEEAAGQPVGTVMAPALLDEPVLFRNGLLDGVPVATAGSHVSHGCGEPVPGRHAARCAPPWRLGGARMGAPRRRPQPASGRLYERFQPTGISAYGISSNDALHALGEERKRLIRPATLRRRFQQLASSPIFASLAAR